MKNGFTASLLLFLVMVLLLPETGWSQSTRERSRRVIKRTSIVMAIARKEVKKNQVYTGDLAKAHNHHQYSVWLWRNNSHVRSIYHSRRARNLAGNAIRANHGQPPAEAMMEEPMELPGSQPSDAELDQEMEMNLSMRVYSDKEALEGMPEDLGF